MPTGKDWADLIRSTFRTVRRQDISGLYSQEWRLARERLTADDRERIEREPRRLRRFLKSANAVLFGLTKRLAPARRVLFGVVLLLLLLSLEGPSYSRHTRVLEDGTRRTVQYGFHFDDGMLIAALILLGLLLAMELVDKIAYRDELELARELQSSLIPRALPEVPGWELAAHNEVANLVGGDIYDFVSLPEGGLAVLFGDASGHGMAAGLVMAVAHAAFRTQLEVDPRPAPMFGVLNRILCRTGTTRAFFGGAYLLLRPDGGFAGSVGGHPFGLLLDAAGSIRGRIGRGAYPLGIRAPLEWPVETGRLEAGETLLLHSDGLSEARNAAGEVFDEARLAASVHRAGGSVSELVQALARDLRQFRGGGLPEDDVSIAAIRFVG
jgi:serine phosphatase RsbU (regulator of sigma subunit)